MTTCPLLQTEALDFGYPGRVVGRGIDLALHPGRVLALLGPNGGGKTTLLKTLLGLLPPRQGRVLLQGQNLASLGLRQRARQLAYVPQTVAGGFAYSVRDLVLMGRTAHTGLFTRPAAADEAAADAALQRLGIRALAQRPVTEVSGGERQLALIARALAQEAQCVVLDEPTAALDFGNQGKVLDEISRLAGQGLAVVFSTHDPNHALRCAHQALLLRDGQVLAQGPAPSVLVASQLHALYRAPVAELHDAGQARRAFLPG